MFTDVHKAIPWLKKNGYWLPSMAYMAEQEILVYANKIEYENAEFLDYEEYTCD